MKFLKEIEEVIEDNVFTQVLLIFLVFLITVLITVILAYLMDSGTYEYIDLNNNSGYAEVCRCREGQNVCYLDDGTVISVKQYKKVG